MSALINEATRALGASGTWDATREAVGAIAIAVLLLVLVMREMVGAQPGGERARRVRDLRVVIVPLGLVFLGVVGPRLADLMR